MKSSCTTACEDFVCERAVRVVVDWLVLLNTHYDVGSGARRYHIGVMVFHLIPRAWGG